MLALACSEGPLQVIPPPPPDINDAALVPNPHNVLSVTVSLRVSDADSAAMIAVLVDGTATAADTTPAVPFVGDSARVPVLGLFPGRRYELRGIVYGPGGATVGDTIEFRTGSLPADLPEYSAGGPDPTPGYVVFAAGDYGLVIDNSGRVVWYRKFPNGLGLNFMAQPNGRYLARPPTPDPNDIEPWVELDALGNITRTFGCALGLRSRFHDIIVQPVGDYWIMCDETQTMDLTPYGGVAAARVTGTAVQHISAQGELLFSWSPFDHFTITDVDPVDRGGESVNWTHGNALDIASDGNLLLSFRSLNEVTKIDTRTGAVLWRMGGRRNQFTFQGTDAGFSAQHSTRGHAPGSILLLDNTGDPSESRAERYEVDESARTARLVHSYGAVPAVVTQIGGSTQALPGDRTLVSFGTAGRVEEYDIDGRVMWRIERGAGYVFRAQRIASLYAPGMGGSR